MIIIKIKIKRQISTARHHCVGSYFSQEVQTQFIYTEMKTVHSVGCLTSSLFVKSNQNMLLPNKRCCRNECQLIILFLPPDIVQLQRNKGLFRIPLFPHLLSSLATVSFRSLSVIQALFGQQRISHGKIIQRRTFNTSSVCTVHSAKVLHFA